MTSVEKINNYFESSIQAKIETANILPPIIDQAANSIISCLENGGRIIICNDDSSSAIAQYFLSKLLSPSEAEKPSLPIITLTNVNIANINVLNEIFARQIAALGNEGDILLAISAEENHKNIINAIKTAHNLNMQTIVLTKASSGIERKIYNLGDIELKIPSNDFITIQENHLLIAHCLCDIINQRLFSDIKN